MLLHLLLPEPRSARPSRRAVVIDVGLALVLAVLAVVAATRFQQLVEPLQLRPSPPARPPSLPLDPGQSEGPPYLPVMLTALPLAVRRWYPLATFWAVVGAALAGAEYATWITVLACAIAAYSAVAHSRYRVVAVACLLLAAVLAGAAFGNLAPELPGWLGPFVVLLSAGLLASLVLFWRWRIGDVRRAQERAVEEERARIAAELHDIVTHNVSVMVIQAGAAREVMEAEPERSAQAMLAIEASGRAALAELRQVMDLLGDTESGLEPQPGLDRLDDLVERVRAAGVEVRVEVPAPPGPLPTVIDLAAYRVVQEGLTNVLKHAAGAAASVEIARRDDMLEIVVTDTSGTSEGSGNGRGLIGLRERLALHGGTLDTGPVPGGGFRLRARLPCGHT